MQIIVNISDDGKVTTEVKHDPAAIETATSSETAAVAGDSLDAGASPFSGAEDTEATQELSAEASEALDGGAVLLTKM